MSKLRNIVILLRRSRPVDRLGSTLGSRKGSKVVQAQKMEKTLPVILQRDESFDVGSDTLTGVNDADYKPPFAFTGKLNKLTIKVDRQKLSSAAIDKLKSAQRNNSSSE